MFDCINFPITFLGSIWSNIIPICVNTMLPKQDLEYMLKDSQANAVICSKDLAETQVEKLKGLAENVDFEDEETFAQKVAQLKESYFATTTKSQEDIFEDEDGPVIETSSSMDSYLKAIKKTANK